MLERWEADDAFRALLEQDPEGAVRSHGLQADPIACRPCWDPTHPANLNPSLGVARPVERYRAFIAEKFAHRDEMRQARPRADNFHAWRLRQMVRVTSQLGSAKSHGIVHPFAAFELSKGCSVGCWFCGISAPKLGDVFLYTPANARLWNDVCQAWVEEIGPAAAESFCYWATDPMDNPDYEQFLCDFHARVGAFPPTTTALPLRDAERTRRLLKLSEERGCLLNRFSILTRKIFEGVHQAFSAEEMAFVELVLQIDKDPLSKQVAGRAMDKARRQGAETFPPGTIACVSGFLVNMVERSVRLISPCPADERWPLGYRVHAQGRFQDGQEFRQLIRDFTSPVRMPDSVRSGDILAFRSDLQWRLGETGLMVHSPFLRQEFSGLPGPALQVIGEGLAKGGKTAGQLALESGADLAAVFLMFGRMLQLGVLDEEPPVVAVPMRKEVPA